MENFKIGLFEILGAIIPGIPISLLLILIVNNLGLNFYFFVTLLENSNTTSVLGFLVLSYAIGFSLQYPSYECFKFFACRIWKKRMGKKPTSIGKRGKELSLIRHKSPHNYTILNTFMAHRTMSYNLSFSLITSSIGCWIIFFINSSKTNLHQLVTISIFTVFLSVLLMRRAVSFHEWIQRIISETYDIVK